MGKRMLAMLLMALMVFSVMPLAVFATEESGSKIVFMNNNSSTQTNEELDEQTEAPTQQTGEGLCKVTINYGVTYMIEAIDGATLAEWLQSAYEDAAFYRQLASFGGVQNEDGTPYEGELTIDVVLYEDVELAESLIIPTGEIVTLDLNGHTVKGSCEAAGSYAVITNYGNLTITDSVGGGAIVCDHKLTGSTAYAVNTITNSGTLTIEDGTIENKSTASNQIGYAIDNNSTSYDAIVVIKGGEVKASGSNYYDGIRLFCNNLSKENSVTVEGGKVSSIWMQNPSDGTNNKDTKEVKGSVAITGGSVDALYLEPSSAFEAAISGGYVGKVQHFATSEGRDLTDFVTGGTFGELDGKFVATGATVTIGGVLYEKDENGTMVSLKPIVAYVSEGKFWGECGYETVTESFVLKLLDAEGNVMGTATLNPELSSFTGGNVYVTWHLSLDIASDTDEWWIQEWITAPTVDNMPATVELWADDARVGFGEVRYTSPDDIVDIYVANADANGTVTGYYGTLADAIAAAENGDTVVLVRDVKQADGIVITDKNLTVDLNGHTFTVTEGASTNNRNVKINGASVVTIQNGTMVAAGDYSSGAYGTVRTEGTAVVTLTDLVLYNYRGNGLNIKALGGTKVNISDTKIYSQYGGGIEAAGGEIVIENVVVEQKGMYTAPYNSMTISVNGGGKVTVNSGTFSTECLTAEEANGQGSSHGPWVAGVLNSGGTLVINGGTFSNDNYGENSLATAARGLILADTAAKIEINGGTFNALKSIIDIQNNLGDAANNPTGTISGGTFSADPTNDYVKLADGFELVENADGSFGVAVESYNGLTGAGTEEDPYLINDLRDLLWFRDAVNGGNTYAGEYIKVADNVTIDLAGIDWEPIGTPSALFQGNFDGNGVTIKNLTIHDGLNYHDGGESYVGLFGYIKNGGYVKNVTVENVEITGCLYVGAVVGRVYIGGVIENCHVKGDIDIEGYWYVGGIVGRYEYGSGIYNCSVSGTADSVGRIEADPDAATNADEDGSYVGGIVGFTTEPNPVVTIKGNSVSYVTVTGVTRVGGISGIAHQGNIFDSNTVANATIYVVQNEEVLASSAATTIGLIAGACQGTDGSPVTFTNCSATDTTVYLNGVVYEVGEYGDNINGGTPVTNYVASVNGVGYATLADAINAAQEGDVIVLLRDVELTNSVKISGKTLTLDLAGYTITDKSTTVLTSSDKVWALFELENGADLTVEGNGRIECNFTNKPQSKWTGMAYAFNVDSDSKITVNNGTFVNGNGVIQTLGEAVVNGGMFIAHNGGTCIMANGTAAKVTVNDGTFTDYLAPNDVYTGSGAVWAGSGATVVINGGTYDFAPDPENKDIVWTLFPAQNAIAGNSGVNANMTVNGGTFHDFNPATDVVVDFSVSEGFTFGSVVAEGFAPVENGNRVYTVVAITYVAEVDGTKYDSLQEAIDAADGKTVVVLADVELAEGLVVAAGKNVTIDLNGKTVSYTSNVVGEDMITNYGTLTIMDSVGGGKITYCNTDTTGNNVTVSTISNCPGGILTVENGTIENTSSNANAFTGKIFPFAIDNLTNGASGAATVTIKGGKIVSNYRSIRLFANSQSDMNTVNINGGEFIGQVWLQASNTNAHKVTLAITDGTFAPAGKDASSVFLTTLNGTAPIFSVTGGNFTTKLGTDNADIATENGGITGGTFATDVSNLCAAGYVVEKNADGTYGIDVTLPEVIVTDIKGSLKDSDPDLTFALNFAIKDLDKLTEAYLEKLMAKYGNHYTDYVLTISGLTSDKVIFNANGNGNGYLAGQYDAWSENWVCVPFEDVEIANGESLYIMEYAAKLMGKQGLRFTLAEVAAIVQNFDCGVYFTPEFLAENPNLSVNLELKVFTEDAEGNKIDNIDVAENEFDKDDFGVAAVIADGKQTQYFTTLQDAIDAADGKTVVLLADVELAEGLVVAAGKNVTIDLNGKTISGVSASAAASAVITNRGTLTIKDEVGGGKITAFAQNPDTDIECPAYANNTITNCGTLNLYSGMIENSTGDEARACFPIDNNSTTGDAIVNIYGGTVVGRGAIRQFANSNTNKNEVNILGGKISGTSYAIWVQNPGSGDPKAALNIQDGTVDRVLLEASTSFDIAITGGTIKTVEIWDATGTDRDPSGFITGGTFSFAFDASFCEEGFAPAKNADGTYGVGKLPNAEVVEIGSATVAPEDSYYIYDLIGGSGLTTGTEPFDLQIIMQFLAKDSAEEAAANAFGNYTTDFFLSISGMEGDSIVADGCYLAGYYASFGTWVVIPLDGFEIENGKVYPVISSVGFDFKYTDICGSVQDFICGIYLSDEILAANPNLNVSLELGLSEDMESAQSAERVTVDQPYVYDVEEIGASYVAQVESADSIFVKNFATLQEAIDAAQAGDVIVLLADVELTSDLSINKAITLNGNGFGITGATVTVNADVTLAGEITFAGLYVKAGELTVATDANVTVSDEAATKGTFGIWDGGKLTVASGASLSAISVYFNGGAIDVYGTLTAISGYDGGLILNGADDVINVYEGGVLNAGYVGVYKPTGNSTVNVMGTATVGAGITDGSGKFTWNVDGTLSCKSLNMANADSALNIKGTVTVTGTASANGTIALNDAAATLATTNGNLTVACGVADYKVAYEDGSYKLVACEYVAEVNGVKYESLQEAIDAAQAGETITLIDDVTVDAAITVAAGKDVILDLAGFEVAVSDGAINLLIEGKLTIEDSVGGGVSTFRNHYVKAGGELIVNGGILQNVATNNGGFAINNEGTVTINGGTVQAVNDSNYAIRVVSGATLTVTGGTVQGNWGAIHNSGKVSVSGGNINVTANVGGHCVYAGVSSTTEISGGTFTPNTESASYVAYVDGEGASVEITDGTFNIGWNKCMLGIASNAVNSSIAVSGGTFFAPVAEEFCAPYYVCEANGDGTYGVRLGDYEAGINGVPYATLEEALNAAQAGDTVKVLTDVDAGSFLIVTDGVILDLNGHTVKAGYVAAFGQIVDNGATKGLLQVGQNKLAMTRSTYPMLPVYNEEGSGYVFVTAKAQLTVKTESDSVDTVADGSFVVKFRPTITGGGVVTSEVFGDGAEDNGISYKIYIHCFNEEGTDFETLDFKVSDELVASAHSGSKMIKLVVNNAAGAFASYQVEIVVESNSGVAYSELSEMFTVTSSATEAE